jgi:copper chaperone CopZ
MKNLIKFMSVFVFVALLASACSQPDAKVSQEVTADSEMVMNIDGMMCESGCKKALEKVLNQAPGVASGTVLFERQQALVKYDSKTTTPEALMALVNESYSGSYTATLAE